MADSRNLSEPRLGKHVGAYVGDCPENWAEGLDFLQSNLCTSRISCLASDLPLRERLTIIQDDLHIGRRHHTYTRGRVKRIFIGPPCNTRRTPLSLRGGAGVTCSGNDDKHYVSHVPCNISRMAPISWL